MATVKIKGMSCQHCVGSVKKALSAIAGISDIEVSLEKGEVHYAGNVDIETVKATIQIIGFDVQ